MFDLYNLTIYQGTTFNYIHTCTGSDGNTLNLSGYQGSGQFKRFYSDTGRYTNLNVSIIGPASGVISIDIASKT